MVQRLLKVNFFGYFRDFFYVQFHTKSIKNQKIAEVQSNSYCRFCKSNWFLGCFFEKVEKLTTF